MYKVSFVIPCYKSAKTIGKVIDEIRESMEKEASRCTYEVILVNDFPADDTYSEICRLAAEDERIIGVNLAKNFGQHAALMAGFAKCTGDVTICLDDDGQTPADEAYKLLDAMEQGADAVYARYANKKHSAFRNFGSRVNDAMARFMIGKPKELYVSSFFGMKRFVREEILRYQNPYPYVIGLVLRTTNNIVNVDVKHREREEGTSGYTLSKLLGLWFNGFTSFSVKPLRVATACGVVFAAIGFIYGIYTIINKLVNPAVPMGWSSTMAALLFIGGVLMLMLGLIGEYIGRIYISLNDAPQYVVKETTEPESEE